MVRVFQPIRRAAAHVRPLRRAQRVAARTDDHGDSPERPADVWQWTRRKYRIRAVVLLLVNAVLFAGLGCFTFWIRTGEYTPLSTGQYRELWWKAFNPTGPEQVTLLDFLLDPIPVDQVPLMMVIVGLVLASLTAIPILVSMLYRFPFSLIFTGVIGFVALLPWLAITVTLCCYLARWRPLRFSFRYATALVSLLPVVLYYVLATQGPSAPVHLPPVEMAKLYLPWVLALLGACMVMGIVLLIARLVNYRPGAIAPLMTIMFAAPVVLFEVEVGRDELYYRLLHTEYGPGSKSRFVDYVEAAELIGKITAKRIDNFDLPPTQAAAVAEEVDLALQHRVARRLTQRDEISTYLHENLAVQQHQAAHESRRFRSRFPNSDYVSNALYLEGQALDMRIDPVLSGFRNMLIIRHYNDFPSPASRPAWQALHDDWPDSPLSSIAGLRLAVMEAREGRLDEAVELLDEVIGRFGARSHEPPATQPAGWKALLARRPASSTLEVDTEGAVLEARKLRELLASHRDPDLADVPLQRLLSFDPRHPMYRRNLERLLAETPAEGASAGLRDHLQVLLARAHASQSVRIERLKACIEQLPSGSMALPRARFELGAAFQEDNRPEEARAIFEEVLRHHEKSPWAAEAGRRLATMSMAARMN
jgi:hypothetical protein